MLLLGYSTGLFSLRAGDLIKRVRYYPGIWMVSSTRNRLCAFPCIARGTPGSYEGLSYLGLGNLVTLPFARSCFSKGAIAPATCFSCCLSRLFPSVYIVRLSNEAFVSTHSLWNIQLPDFIFKVFSLFRFGVHLAFLFCSPVGLVMLYAIPFYRLILLLVWYCN